MTTNASKEQLKKALEKINQKYNNNIKFNRLEQTSANRRKFTLKTKDSDGDGAARAASGRRTASACWHVHGDFFDTLINMNEELFVHSAYTGRIDKDGGNWVDVKKGSRINPVYMSELCECN